MELNASMAVGTRCMDPVHFGSKGLVVMVAQLKYLKLTDGTTCVWHQKTEKCIGKS